MTTYTNLDHIQEKPTEVWALAIDDVDTKVSGLAVTKALGNPTAIVETDAGNYQWMYRLTKPVPVKDWPGFYAEVERLVGMPLGDKSPTRLMRLPMGVNTKTGFKVRLEAMNPLCELNPATIMSRAPSIYNRTK